MRYGSPSKNTRHLFYSLILLVVYLFTVSQGALPTMFGVSAIPVIPLVIFIAMYENDLAGSIYGIAGGVLLDINSSVVPGFNTLALLIIGTVSGLLVAYIMRNNLRSALFLTFISCLFYFSLQWLLFTVIPARGDVFFTFFRFNFIQIIYTTLYMIPIYFLLRLFAKKYKTKDNKYN